MSELLQSDGQNFGDLVEYAERCHALLDGLSSQHNISNPSFTVFNVGTRTFGDKSDEESDYSDHAPDDEEISNNPLDGFPPLIAADPLSVSTPWRNSERIPTSSKLQIERYKRYVFDCKTLGVMAEHARPNGTGLAEANNNSGRDFPS